jgi:hypothetical protein
MRCVAASLKPQSTSLLLPTCTYVCLRHPTSTAAAVMPCCPPTATAAASTARTCPVPPYFLAPAVRVAATAAACPCPVPPLPCPSLLARTCSAGGSTSSYFDPQRRHCCCCHSRKMYIRDTLVLLRYSLAPAVRVAAPPRISRPPRGRSLPAAAAGSAALHAGSGSDPAG